MIMAPTSTSPQQLPYAVLVEQQENGHWIAQVLGWAECRAEGTNRETAIASLQKVLHDRLSRAEIIYLDMPKPTLENPLMKYAGMFKDDPQFDQVLAEIAAYRRELDAERDELADFYGDESLL